VDLFRIYKTDYRQSLKIEAPSIVHTFVTVTRDVTSDVLLENYR